MNLREDIQRIQEVMGVEVSTRFKRKLHILDRLIDTLIEDSMYKIDYENENEFFNGVIEELYWLVRNENFGLDDIEWGDIYDYISHFKEDEIKEHFREFLHNKNV